MKVINQHGRGGRDGLFWGYQHPTFWGMFCVIPTDATLQPPSVQIVYDSFKYRGGLKVRDLYLDAFRHILAISLKALDKHGNTKKKNGDSGSLR